MMQRRIRAERTIVSAAIAFMLGACGSPVTTTARGPESPPPASPVTPGGYRWLPVDPGQFGGVRLTAITATTGPGLFAIGDLMSANAPDGRPRHPTTWTSPDGRAWTRLPDNFAFVSRRNGREYVVTDLVAAGDGFVAVGLEEQTDGSSADAAAWSSPDGHTWAQAIVADGTGRTMDQVVATDDGFVAIGEARYDVHAGFGAGTAIWTSTDGLTWTRLADTEAPARGTALRAIAAGPPGFLAAASLEHPQGDEVPPRQPVTAGIWRSDDAIHWEPVPGSPLGVAQIVHMADGWIALGSTVTGATAAPVWWRSQDGRSWTRIAVPPLNGLPAGTSVYGQRLAGGAAGILALGEREDDFSAVGWSSVDGVGWTPLDLAPILAGATVDELHAVGGSILLVGDRMAAGAQDPVVWLLAP